MEPPTDDQHLSKMCCSGSRYTRQNLREKNQNPVVRCLEGCAGPSPNGNLEPTQNPQHREYLAVVNSLGSCAKFSCRRHESQSSRLSARSVLACPSEPCATPHIARTAVYWFPAHIRLHRAPPSSPRHRNFQRFAPLQRTAAHAQQNWCTGALPIWG